ncbi:MAG: rRNA maturation RNase YbeY [Pseudomonadota bacterium]
MVAKRTTAKSANSTSQTINGTAKPTLKLATQYALDKDSLPTRHQFRRWVLAALESDAEVALRVVDEVEGRELNRDYRSKDYATNVLTFEYGEPFPGQPLMGDIALCAPVVAREAKEQGKDLHAHYAHLTVHGVLHMQGYDHEKTSDAEIMEGREIQILATLGLPNPYENER